MGTRGGRSFAQSKKGLMTTGFGMKGALSRSFLEVSGSSK
jgi:hypothetical protein